jgi:O-antigen/teichoic acid export membrane protein
MNLSKKILYSGTATVVNTVGGIVRNKIYAVYLSLSFFGVLSLGQQFISVVTTLFSFGLPLGVTTLSASYLTREKEEQSLGVSRLVVLSVVAAVGLEILLLIVLMFFKQNLSMLLFGSDKYEVPMMILLHAVPCMIVSASLYGVMEGMGKLRAIVIFKTLPIICSLPIIYFLSSNYLFLGASVSVLVGEGFVALVALYLLREHIVLSREVFWLGETVKELFKVAVLSFIVGSITLLSDFVVKRFVLSVGGETANGIVQSVAKVTDLYPMIVLSWLAMHLFPSLAHEKENRQATANVIQRTAFIAGALIIPIVFILFLFREQILELIYQKEFVLASQYFGLMLSTGVLKVFSWVIGVALLAAGFRRLWFYSSLLYAAIFFAVSSIGLSTPLSFYALPLGVGTGLMIQIGYVLYEYRRHSIYFPKNFFIQLLIYTVISILFCLAIFYNVLLIVIIVLYAGYTYHYGFVQEIKTKVQELLRQA